MKNINPWFLAFIALLLFVVWQNWPGEKTVKKVDVPEVKGGFSAVKPDAEIIVQYKDRDTAEDSRLKRLYNLSQEELDKIRLHNQNVEQLAACTKDSLTNAIAELSRYQEFCHDFENEFLKATVTGISMGPVERLAIPEFTVKKRTVEVPEKQVKFRVIGGGEVGVNKELNQGTWKLDLFVQDKGNNLYSGSYQQIGGQKYFLAGVHKSIFTIKK